VFKYHLKVATLEQYSKWWSRGCCSENNVCQLDTCLTYHYHSVSVTSMVTELLISLYAQHKGMNTHTTKVHLTFTKLALM